MMLLLGVSFACASAASYCLLTLSADPRRQRSRLMWAVGWLVAGYAAHWAAIILLMGESAAP